MDEAKELVRLLLRRDDVLSAIRDGPVRIRELTERVAVSRPTVHRSLQELAKNELTKETPRGYVLTSYGETVLDKYSVVIDEFDDIRANRELLLALGETRLPPAVLEGAECTMSLPFAPERPIAEIEAMVRGATTIDAFSPVIVERYIALFYEQVTVDELDANIVTSTDVFDYLTSQWSDELETALAAGLNLTIVDETIPFGLVVTGSPKREICVIVYDDGSLRGIIRNDSDAALDWGLEQFRRYRDASRIPEFSKL